MAQIPASTGFDPDGYEWLLLRDLVYAKEHTKHTNTEICHILKGLFPRHDKAQAMTAQKVEQIYEWGQGREWWSSKFEGHLKSGDGRILKEAMTEALEVPTPDGRVEGFAKNAQRQALSNNNGN